MTMMTHLLIRLHGNEDWESWGNDWWDHIDRVGELPDDGSWYGPPGWLDVPEKGKRRLDWGAFLYEVPNFADVRRLVLGGASPDDAGLDDHRRSLLESLSENDSYGLIYVESY